MNQQRYNFRGQHILTQRGAALMVMLVILIVGSLAFLVTSLSKATLSLERNNRSSELLGISKEALLGYVISGSGGYPGNLFSPDALSNAEAPAKNYDGTFNSGCLDKNNPSSGNLIANGSDMRCLGRLPWKTLKLPIIAPPSDNDPSGLMPWYAVSANMVDPTVVTFNSELLNTDNTLHLPNNYPAPPHPWLTVRDINGNVLSDRVAFLVIIPGPSLTGQSRPAYPTLAGPDKYLDSITVPAGCTMPCTPGAIHSNADADDDFIMADEHRWIADPANAGKQIEDSSYYFNDKLLYVTIDELMPLIEKRIAREVKNCLDAYALTPVGTPSNKYPWATSVTDTTYTGTHNTLFGRIPNQPNINTSSTPIPAAITLSSALNALQLALDTYFAVGNATNRIALINAGNYVISLKNSIPAISTTINTAGTWSVQFAAGSHTYSGVSGKISTAQADVTNETYSPDHSMSASWPASCTLLTTSPYWVNWKPLVFYQIAEGYKPGGSLACFASCLTVNGSGNTNGGSGNYRAAVAVAGKMKTGQTARNLTVVSDYLETSNQTGKTDIPTTTTFETYKTSDTTNYNNVNDVILCADGKNNCK